MISVCFCVSAARDEISLKFIIIRQLWLKTSIRPTGRPKKKWLDNSREDCAELRAKSNTARCGQARQRQALSGNTS